MKRLALLVVAAAIAGGAGLYLWQQSPAHSAAAVTSLLPQETAALVHLPDCNRLRDDFEKSELYQLYREPTVQEFLRHRSDAAPVSAWQSDLNDFEQLAAKDLFVAVTSVANDRINFVTGFRFAGDAKKADRVVGRLRQQLLGSAAATPIATENYGSHKIETFSGAATRVAMTYAGDWFFAANQIDELKAVLDRIDKHSGSPGAAPGSTAQATPQPVLANSERFRSAIGVMPSAYSLLFYLDPKLFRALLAQWRPNESGFFEQVAAVCATSRFDNGQIHDVVYVEMPKRPGNAVVTRKSAGLGSKDTFLYGTSLLNLSSGFTAIDPGLVGTFLSGFVRKFSDAMERAKITMTDWEAAFGAEVSVLADWPPEAHWPSLLLAFPVRDFAKAQSLAGVIARAADDDADWREFDRNGVHYLAAQAPPSLFVLRPTIAVTEQMMIAGVDPGSVDAAAQRSLKLSDGLTAAAPYKSATSLVSSPTSFFAYVDLATVYGRLETTLRPLLAMGAAFAPAISQYVDLSRMAPADVVAKHLTPVVTSQRYEGHGYVTESVGPVTLSHAGLAALFFAGSTYHPHTQALPTPTPADTP